MRKIALLYSVFCLSANVFAQEAIYDLSVNPIIQASFCESEIVKQKSVGYKGSAIQVQMYIPHAKKVGGINDTIDPNVGVNGFFDDFSFSVFSNPDPSLWMDTNVFINSNYPVNQPTIGVATFDGLKKNGMPYNFAQPNSQGLADFLTSKYIYMENMQLSDSVYLSFYYQAQGRGNAPEVQDSLVLEFKDSLDNWLHIWAKSGYSIASDSSFFRVMIPISAPKWFYNGFQLRFKNYATLSGNLDHWNLDYVKLNDFRSITDTIFDDIAFVTPILSLLKEYTSVPWKHYNTSMMVASISNNFRNLFSTKVVDFKYNVFRYNGTSLHNQGIVTDLFLNGFNKCNQANGIISAPISFSYVDTTACIDYFVKQSIKATSDAVRNNDTLRFIQRVENYFSYDDGSAEAAYGLTQPYSSLAYKFIMTVPDTLTGVKFHFNPVVNDVSLKQFKLTVWDHDVMNNRPRNIIYQSDIVYNPQYTYCYNGFSEYPIDSLFEMNDVFYVGWQQNSADLLNVGLDRNIDNTANMFYNTNGNWLNTQFPGSWMIRPVFGKCYLPAGIENSEVEKDVISMYPNPASNLLYIKGLNTNDCIVNVIDMLGKIVISQAVKENEGIDISEISNGIYLLRIVSPSNALFYTSKVIINK